MIKLIATDLDNTLLNSRKEVTAGSIRLLRRCAAAGVSFAVATGRSLYSAEAVAAKIGIDHWSICYNGALITDPVTGEVLVSDSLDEKTVRDIVEFCHARGLYMQMYDNNVITVEKLQLDQHPDPDLKYAPHREIGDFLAHPFFPTPKVLVAAGDRVPEVHAELIALFGERVYIAQSEAHLLEIMSPGTDKGAALRLLAGHLGLEKDEIIAFGDNTNDLPLLENAGIAVAVANSVEVLKSAATYVAEGERNRGFDEGIRRFVLTERRAARRSGAKAKEQV